MDTFADRKQNLLYRISIETLLPADYRVKRDGRNLSVDPCPFCGHKDCFKLQGDDFWRCFSEDKSGDLIDYWSRMNAFASPGEALTDLEDRYGAAPPIAAAPPAAKPNGSPIPGPKPLSSERWQLALSRMDAQGPHWDWFERYGIIESAWRGLVGFEPEHPDTLERRRPALLIPELTPEGAPTGRYKSRYIDEPIPEGLRKTKTAVGNFLIGSHLIDSFDPNQPVVVCAGEKDWLVARSIGLTQTVTPAAGEGSLPDDFALLLQGFTVVLALDADAPGKAAAKRHVAALTEAGLSAHAVAWPRGWLKDGAKDLTNFVSAGHQHEIAPLIARAAQEPKQEKAAAPEPSSEPRHDERPVTAAPAPPQNLDAEKAVLGALLLDPTAVPVAIDMLRPSDFYSPPHQRIFESIVRLNLENTPVDPTTLYNDLRKHHHAEEVGGLSYLTSLEMYVTSTQNIAHHCAIIREKAQLRRMITVAGNVAAEAYKDTTEAPAVLDRFRTWLDKEEARSLGLAKTTRTGKAISIMGLDSPDFTIPDSYWGETLLPEQEIAMLAAEMKIGKSIFCLQAGACLAMGLPLFNLRTKMCRVLYVQNEVSDGFQKARFWGDPAKGWTGMAEYLLNGTTQEQYDSLRANLFYMTECRGFTLRSGSLEEDGRNFRHLAHQIELVQPNVLILDPFSAFFPGNDSDPELVADAFVIFNRLINAFNLTLLYSHHFNKLGAGQSKGPKDSVSSIRGHTSLQDKPSTLIELMHVPRDPVDTHVEIRFRVRNGPPISPFFLRRPAEGFPLFERDNDYISAPSSGDNAPRKPGRTPKAGEHNIESILMEHDMLSHAVLVKLLTQKADCDDSTARKHVKKSLATGFILESDGFCRLANRPSAESSQSTQEQMPF